MTQPSIDVLGVHRVRATDAMIQDRIEYSYLPDQVSTPQGRRAAEQESRELIESVVLIETVVRNCDERFDVGDFTQRLEGVARENWQAAYLETFLALDGASRDASDESPDAPGDIRVAFFLHDWDAGKPLAASYGDVDCPPPSEMPERLEKLVPYENVS
jgi:hypothetical protein